MATTYRYMAIATPTTIGLIGKQLDPSVGAISIMTPPPTMLDVTLTNTSVSDKADLDAYMTSIGYFYMETDPTPLTNGETVVWEDGAWTCVHVSPTTTTSLVLETSSKKSFAEKAPHTFICKSATAKYFILYDASYETTSKNCRVEVQLILDGTTVLAKVIDKPGGVEQQRKFTGHIEGAAYGSGAHTVAIEYKVLGGSGSIKISDAKITTWSGV